MNASSLPLAGRAAVITGATSGIGRATAEALARRGARILLVGRDPERLRETLESLPAAPCGGHAAYAADLLRLSEMKRLAGEIAAAEPAIDLLINNAGAIFPERGVTEDGLERTFALNHLAYFVVTLGLLERVKSAAAGRVLITASRMHGMARLDFDDLQSERRYNSTQAYARSKLCNILFARALARREAGSGIVVNALHPGYVATRMGADDRSAFGALDRWMKRFALSPEAGARTTLHVAQSETAGRSNGGYFARSKPARPSAAAQVDADGERLWAASARLAGLAL